MPQDESKAAEMDARAAERDAAKATREADKAARKEQKHPAGIDAPDPVLEPGEVPPALPTAEEFQAEQDKANEGA